MTSVVKNGSTVHVGPLDVNVSTMLKWDGPGLVFVREPWATVHGLGGPPGRLTQVSFLGSGGLGGLIFVRGPHIAEKIVGVLHHAKTVAVVPLRSMKSSHVMPTDAQLSLMDAAPACCNTVI